MEHQDEVIKNDADSEENVVIDYESGADQLEDLESILDVDKAESEIVEKEDKDEFVEKQTDPVVEIVNDELIEQYPILRTLKDKPVTEVAKSYAELQKEYDRLNKSIKEKEANGTPEADPKEELEEEPQGADLMPDPFDEPDKFKEWMEARTDVSKIVEDKLNAEKEAKAKLEKEAEKERELAEKYQKDVETSIKELIPNEDPSEIIKFYMEQNKDLIMQDGKLKPHLEQAFINDEKFLVNTVVDYYHKAILEANGNKLAKNKAFSIVKNSLSKAPSGKLSHESVTFNPREKTEDEKLVEDLYELIE